MTQDSARKEVDRERNCTPLNFFSENHKASNHEKTKLLILDTKKPVGVQLGYKKYVPQWGYSPQKTLILITGTFVFSVASKIRAQSPG